MTSILRGTPQRLFALLALALAAVVAVVTLTLRPAQAAVPNLRPMSVQALLAATHHAMRTPASFSGHVQADVNLGLPSGLVGLNPSGAPSNGGGSGTSGGALGAISGTHSLRIWAAPSGMRLQELLPTAERDIVVNRTGVWSWSSQTFSATHVLAPARSAVAPAVARARTAILPGLAAAAAQRGITPGAFTSAVGNPATLGQRVLSMANRSTQITVGQNAWVGGRAAYALTLTPRTTGTLVRRAVVWIDAARHVPLGVGVWARGSSQPVIDVSFTSVHFGPQPASLFAFQAPKGAHVRTITPTLPKAMQHPTTGVLTPAQINRGLQRAASKVHAAAAHVKAQGGQVIGKGWSAVVVAPISPRALTGRGAKATRALEHFLPLSTSLLSVRMVHHGGHAWLLIGAVPQARLAAIAARLG